MSIKSVLLDWDARDVRGIIVATIFLLLAIYFQPFSALFVSLISSTSSTVLNALTSNLYYTASGNPESGLILAIYAVLIMFVALFTIRPRILRRIIRLPDEKSTFILPYRLRTLLFTIKMLLAIFVIGLYLSLYIYIAFPIAIHDSFMRDVNIVTPYLADNKRAILISKWSSMHSASEYKAIRNFIDDAKAHIPLTP